MPDRRTHRGPHPEDHRLFAPDVWPVLRQAAADLCWLLERGYAEPSSLKLVGDRYNLVARQRVAVARAACAESLLVRRRAAEVPPEAVQGWDIWLDGYNVLTTVEAALSGGVLLVCRDGTLRDMASMHGSYRKVAETVPAIELIGQVLSDLRVRRCRWYLDSPVSNSGRLKQLIEAVGRKHRWPWEVCLTPDPDPILISAHSQSASVFRAASLPRQHQGEQLPILPITFIDRPMGEVWTDNTNDNSDELRHRQPENHSIAVATADSAILNACRAWLNLARHVVVRCVPGAVVVDLSM